MMIQDKERKMPKVSQSRRKKLERKEQPRPTPEELARAMLKLPADHEWEYLKADQDPSGKEQDVND